MPPTRGHTRTGGTNESGRTTVVVTAMNSTRTGPASRSIAAGPGSPRRSVPKPAPVNVAPATSSCQMPSVGSTARRAAAASSRPQPVSWSGPAGGRSSALSRIRCWKSVSISSGRAAASRPTVPVANGAANDVPESMM